jgi:glypican 4 (K-glypican)
MENLFDESQRQFHDIFKRTYGVLYEKNSMVFREYFAELRDYFYHGRVNLVDSTATFFATLYQKMFQVKIIFFG